MKIENWEEQFHELIVNHFNSLKAAEPSLSLRKFAKRAQLSPGAMTKFLNKSHNWRLTPARALEVLSALDIDFHQRNYFAAFTGAGKIDIPRTPIPAEDYEILKDWTFLPILVSFDLADRPSPQSLASRLGISVEKVIAVTSTLLEKGYLKLSPTGEIFRDKSHWETSDGPPNQAIRQHHKMNLEMATKALEVIPVEKRYFMSMTFAGNKEEINFVKSEIKKLFDKTSSVMENTLPTNEIYKLSVNLFPIDFECAKEG